MFYKRYGLKLRAFVQLLIIMLATTPSNLAHAGAIGCVKSRIASLTPGDVSFGIASSQAEQMVAKISNSIGLSASGIKVVSCYDETKAAVVDPDIHGHYIVYNPEWLQEVMGDDEWQMIAIFAHELGHYVDGHFSRNRSMSRLEKELAADYFAGCAVGRLGGPWGAVDNLFRRLRNTVDIDYPNRVQSLTRLREGYESCSAGAPAQTDLVEETIQEKGKLNLETAFKSGDGYGYVYLGKVDYSARSWVSKNFSIQGAGDWSQPMGQTLVSINGVNVRGSLPVSEAEMGPKIGEIPAGTQVRVTNFIAYRAPQNHGWLWAQIELP